MGKKINDCWNATEKPTQNVPPEPLTIAPAMPSVRVRLPPLYPTVTGSLPTADDGSP